MLTTSIKVNISLAASQLNFFVCDELALAGFWLARIFSRLRLSYFFCAVVYFSLARRFAVSYNAREHRALTRRSFAANIE